MSALPRTSDGFTLVELLVAVTLLGLLAAVLFGGVRLGRRAWEAGDARSARSSRMEIVETFLREQLSETRPVSAAALPVASDGIFDGRRDGIAFVAPLYAQFAARGLYLVSLTVERSAAGKRLGIAWEPRDGAAVSAAGGSGPAPETLVDGMADIEFSYFGTPGPGPPGWYREWSGIDHLPSLLRIRFLPIARDDEPWPDLLVAPRMSALRAPASGAMETEP